MCKLETLKKWEKKLTNFATPEVFIGFIPIWLLKGRIFARITTVTIYSTYMVYIERKYEITWFMCSRVKWISLFIFVYCKHDLVLFIGGIYGTPLSWLDLNSNTKTRLLHNNEVNIYCSFSKYTYQSSFDWLLNWLVIFVLEFTIPSFKKRWTIKFPNFNLHLIYISGVYI